MEESNLGTSELIVNGRRFKVRNKSMDSAIVDLVFVKNEYNLDNFNSADIVMDVGSHIGSFATAAATRGSRRVHCYEVNPENRSLLKMNVADICIVENYGLWRSDIFEPELKYNKSSDKFNTGGGGIDSKGEFEVEVLPFDFEVIRLLHRYKANKIRFLKLDCEGSEFPILLTSRYLSLIDEIRGEYHLGYRHKGNELLGRSQFYLEDISSALEKAGFKVEFVESNDPMLGYFFARRF
jgi:FkbM family methyltransferase